MINAVIFDLYDTLVDELGFDFKSGLEYLYGEYFADACSQEDFFTYSAQFLPNYDRRRFDNSEVCLIRDEISLYFSHFGVIMPDSDRLERELMATMQSTKVADGAVELLRQLHELGTICTVLTNSIFTCARKRELLDRLGLGVYIADVISSADCGIRKPSGDIFMKAIERVQALSPTIGKDEILYVGNDYKSDIIGASKIGLKAAWLNKKNESDRESRVWLKASTITALGAQIIEKMQ